MSQVQSGFLKKSQKMDFSTTTTTTPTVTREKSFTKQNKDMQNKRRSQTMTNAIKGGKPTLEIYRPPNVRTDLPQNMAGGKLNVHAKEFTMSHDLQTSKSSGNLAMDFSGVPLQHSKSSGNVLRHVQNTPPGLIPLVPAPIVLPVMHSTSTSQILNHVPRVNFQIPNEILQHPVFTGQNHQTVFNNYMNNHHHHHHQQQQQQQPNNQNLKRSKSLSAADSQKATKLKSFSKEDTDLGVFSPEEQANIKMAVEDPNQLPSRTLMELVKIILERVVEGIRYSEAGAKLCINIIEREKNHTFIETLINTCQQWYQERDKLLRGIKAGDGTRFTAFMWFLTEMCGQLKRAQLMGGQLEALQPELVLLSVLAKCCQACVSLPIKCLSETECLFFVLTSIGRDLEAELPQQLEQLLASVRDGFLASAGVPAVRKTLLQLIELHASNWQLPGSSVLYYYPRIK